MSIYQITTHEGETHEHEENAIVIRRELIYERPYRYYAIGLVREEIDSIKGVAEEMGDIPAEFHHVERRKIYMWKVGEGEAEPEPKPI